MDTHGLPREEWGAFFDDLSREFESGLVTVEVSGDALPHVILAEGLPLLGITFDTKGSEAGSLTIIAGQDEDTAVSHTVAAPTHVNIARTADGSVDVVQIDAPDPAQTRIHFLSSI